MIRHRSLPTVAGGLAAVSAAVAAIRRRCSAAAVSRARQAAVGRERERAA